jgi:hypothetical protein
VFVEPIASGQEASEVEAALMERWRFLRRPVVCDPETLRGVVVLACPELSPRLYGHDVSCDAYIQALGQCDALEDGLIAWSVRFPDRRFVLMTVRAYDELASCDGFVCQAGALLERQEPSPHGHITLLEASGWPLEGHETLAIIRHNLEALFS